MTRLKDVLEQALVDEIPHFIEPTHSKWFIEPLGNHCSVWNEATAEPNELPLASAVLAEQRNP